MVVEFSILSSRKSSGSAIFDVDPKHAYAQALVIANYLGLVFSISATFSASIMLTVLTTSPSNSRPLAIDSFVLRRLTGNSSGRILAKDDRGALDSRRRGPLVSGTASGAWHWIVLHCESVSRIPL